jgi:Ca-activated chloride channel family protein
MMQQQSARLETRAGEALTLQGVRFTGTLRGTLFEADLEQRFANPFERHVELVYSFPLPWAAVLLGVEVQIGERRLSGAVIEKSRPSRATRTRWPRATPPSCSSRTSMAATR